MMKAADKEKLNALIIEAISELCKSGVSFNEEICVEGLIGITVDRDEVVLINLKKTVVAAADDTSDDDSYSDAPCLHPHMESQQGAYAKQVHRHERDHSDRVEVTQEHGDQRCGHGGHTFDDKQHHVKEETEEHHMHTRASTESHTGPPRMESDMSGVAHYPQIPSLPNLLSNPIAFPDQMHSAWDTSHINFGNTMQAHGHGDGSSQSKTPASRGAEAFFETVGLQQKNSQTPSKNQKAKPPSTPDEKSHKCRICGVETARKDSLARHMKVHTGEKPHKCPMCDYRTAHKYQVAVHMRKHTGEKPFQCNQCDYRASTSCSIRVHMKNIHEKQSISATYGQAPLPLAPMNVNAAV